MVQSQYYEKFGFNEVHRLLPVGFHVGLFRNLVKRPPLLRFEGGI